MQEEYSSGEYQGMANMKITDTTRPDQQNREAREGQEKEQESRESREEFTRRLPLTVLAALTALFHECVKTKGCGRLHAYAIAKKMGISHRAARLALLSLEEMGAAKRHERVVDGRLRVEYELTPYGKELAIGQLEAFLRERRQAAKTKSQRSARRPTRT